MSDLERPSAAEIVKNPIVWPVPAVVIGCFALFSPAMWKAVEATDKAGRLIRQVPAHEFLLFLGGILAVYYISFVPIVRELIGYGHALKGMSPASDAEKGCAVAIIRYASLLLLYAMVLGHIF